MSLIEEALRRVQDPMVSAEPWATKTPSKGPAKRFPKTSLRRSLPFSLTLVAVTVLVLSLGFILGAVLWGKQMLAPQPSLKQRLAGFSSKNPVAAPATEELILTGVVEGQGEPYAVMNGAIVAVGERIREYTLVEIADGAVRLRNAKGTEVTLRVRR